MKFFDAELIFEDVVMAYFDCRKSKRNSIHALDFEFNLEKNLFILFENLKSGRYIIGQSIAFVVDQPTTREIWAATFRDRIVHHVIYNKLKNRFYPTFIRDTFACIPERGTLDGTKRLNAGLRSATENFQKPMFYLKSDIRSFFVNIDKNILFGILQKKITEKWLLDLVHQVLFHDPRLNCYLKSDFAAFQRVPKHKSLWSFSDTVGLPIGNLTSQFFANVYLNEIDQFIKQQLKAKYYYRYMDDFIVLHDNIQWLNSCYDQISVFLKTKLNLELHPFKKRIASVCQGVDFIGFIHKPFSMTLRPRTANKMNSLVHQWKKHPRRFDADVLLKFRNSMNAYLGLAKDADTFRLRQHIGQSVNSFFIQPDDKYLKLSVFKSLGLADAQYSRACEKLAASKNRAKSSA